MVQRLVIDSNMLQTWTLRAYLMEGPDNFVVLPDFVWIEVYKQQSVAGVVAAFSVIRDFPDRVLVLKSGRELAGIDPRRPDLIERMLLDDIAGSIRMTADALSQAESGDPAAMVQLADQWSRTTAHVDGMMEGAADIVRSLSEIAEIFSADELRRCRTYRHYTSAMIEKIFGAADQIYETLLESYDAHSGYMSPEHRYGAYLYRYALAIMVYTLWWIRNGSQEPKRLDRARNDFIDLGFAVCGTYFDGLMTEDDKARWMHDNLSAALSAARQGTTHSF